MVLTIKYIQQINTLIKCYNHANKYLGTHNNDIDRLFFLYDNIGRDFVRAFSKLNSLRVPTIWLHKYLPKDNNSYVVVYYEGEEVKNLNYWEYRSYLTQITEVLILEVDYSLHIVTTYIAQKKL